MIFNSEEEIRQFLKDRPMGDEIDEAVEVHRSLLRYVTGKGLVDSIGYDSYFEKHSITDKKKKLAKSTRDMVERLIQPMERVFTAKGGAKLYYLDGNREEEFEGYLSKVRKGMSMRQWMHGIAFKAYLTDPMGLFMTEVSEDAKSYPTYKSIEDIHAYILDGRQPLAVAFTVNDTVYKKLLQAGIVAEDDKKEWLYRIVDDLQDVIVKYVEDEVTVLNVIKHDFGKVPALLCSDIVAYDGVSYESPLMSGMEIIAEYFDGDADKALYKKTILHPREWSIEIQCAKCEGEKKIDGKDCGHCDGTGINPHIKLSDRLTVIADDDGKATVPIPPGGFYSASIEPFDRIKQDLYDLEQMAEDTIYERRKIKKTAGVTGGESDITATGELLNEKSKEPKLRKISKWGAATEKELTDHIKVHSYGSNAKESAIIWGDRYIHGTVEQLSEEYHKMVAKGSPVSLLDSFLIDIIEAKFESNPIELEKHKKLMNVEPFVHYKVSDVLNWSVSDNIKLRKMYFSDWLNTVDDIIIVNPSNTEQKLVQLLDKYIADNGYAINEVNQNQVA